MLVRAAASSQVDPRRRLLMAEILIDGQSHGHICEAVASTLLG